MRQIRQTLIIQFFLGVFILFNARGQTLPVGTPVLEDYYRRMQLMGKLDSSVSFATRPLSPLASFNIDNIFDPDSSLRLDAWVSAGPSRFAGDKGIFQILPITLQQQYNSNHPYGWNDGAMIPAKGYQTMFSAGVYLKWGLLSIQLRPEYVYAVNPAFDGFATTARTDKELGDYYNYFGNFLDRPERFGDKSYSKLFWGQSSVSVTVGPIAASLSTENVWWGPGIHNSLIISNNAPGFEHVSVHTVKPVKSFLGQFEGEILAGYLTSSGYASLPVATTSTGINLAVKKQEEKRYFTGFNLIYQPKWTPGFTLGLTRTFNAYANDVKTLSAYIPFFTPYSKASLSTDGDPFDRDQYTSFYARYVLPKAKAEIYFEYGINDNSYNVRDFIGSPDHSRAYIFGFRKMLPITTHKDENILIGAEITQLSQSPDRITREAGTWYVHSGVLHGHTNQGQYLGAGTGSGSNLQNFNISWVKGLKRLGVSFERLEHNVDFTRFAFADIDGNSRRWVDFAVGFHGEWNYKNLLFNATVQNIRSLNYQWVLRGYTPGQYYIPNNTVNNLHANLGVSFRF